MSGPHLLFVHGGGDGAYDWDKKLSARLQEALGDALKVDVPHIPALEALDWPGVAKALGKRLRDLPAGSIVVAHSIGASAVLKLLVEGLDPKLRHLFLLAAPYNGADGEWGDGDFAFAADFAERLPKGLPITFWHSKDDETMPVSNVRRYADKLPDATVHVVDGYGHQFEKSLKPIADAIKAAAT